MAKPKARYKTIRADFIEDDRCATATLPALLLYNFMKVFCDDKGFIPANDRLIISKCFPQREDVTREYFAEMIANLEANKLLVSFTHKDGRKYYALDFTFEKLDREKESELGADAPIFFPIADNARCVATMRDESGQRGVEVEREQEKEHETETGGDLERETGEKPPQPEKKIGEPGKTAETAAVNPAATQQHPPPSAAPPLNGLFAMPGTAPPRGAASAAWQQLNPPFGNEVYEKWVYLCGMKKWRKKEQDAITGALDQLKKYPEAFALLLIEAAIGGGWQGVVFADTPVKYDKWKKSKSSKNGANDTTSLTGAIVPERVEYGQF